MPTPTDAAGNHGLTDDQRLVYRGIAVTQSRGRDIHATVLIGQMDAEIETLTAALTAARAEVERLTAEKRTAYILLDNIHRALMPDGIAFGQYTHAELIAMIRDATAGFTTPPTAADADGTPPQRDPAGEGESE